MKMQACSVVLERLDENFYSKRYGLNITTPNCHKSREVNRNENKKRIKKKFEESVKNKPKRRKVRPLCYSDSEDSSSNLDYEQSVNKVKNEKISEDNSTLNHYKILDRNSEDSNESKEQEICNSVEKTSKENDSNIVSDNLKVTEELFFESTNYKEDEKVSLSIFNNEIANCNEEINYNEDNSSFLCIKDEDNFLDHSESDKSTVICEEKMYENNNCVELLNLENEHDETVKLGKTRKKEIEEKKSIKSPQNVKKVKTPVKENREDSKGRTSVNGISEDSLKEVCRLVMRLNELHRTILQLQKELPKNDDLAVHFLKVISVQQENFRKEIRKSQKTILQCYEKMLVSYNDPNKAASEIARRTSLNPEDIINVISCCLLLEGACEMEKLKNDGIEQTKTPDISGFQPQRVPEPLPTELEIIHESLVRPPVNDNQHFVSSHSSSLSSELVQRLTMDYTLPREPTEKVQSIQLNKSLVPPYNGHSERTQYERNNSSLSNFDKVQVYGNPSASQVIHDRRQKDQYLVLRNPPQIISDQPVYVQSRPANVISHKPNHYPGNSSDFRRQSNLSSTHQRIRTYPSPRENNPYVVNYVPENYVVPQPYRRSSVTSNAGFAIPKPVTRNTVEWFSAPNNSASNWSNLPGYSFPSQNFETIPQNQIPTYRSDVQPPLVGFSSSPAQPYSNQAPLRRTSVPTERMFDNEKSKRNSQVEINSSVDTNDTSENILDPTVPQKLTMKNCRLQAGPVLSFGSDSEVSDKSHLNEKNDDKKLEKSDSKVSEKQPLREGDCKKSEKSDYGVSEKKHSNHSLRKSDCKKLETSSTKESKSRVYVCALNGCENPGVRICKGCQSTIYCSGTCQLKHWTHKHKVECYQLKELRVQHGEL